MLTTFLVGNANTVIGDDKNIAGNGRCAFRWEEFSVEGAMQIQPSFGGQVPFKGSDGNIDRKLGFRIGRSLASIAAISTFLKTVDALVLSKGTLTLQPDESSGILMVYTNAILKSATLVPGADDTVGKRVTLSYKFECLTLQ